MRENHRNDQRKSRAGINAGTVPPAGTAEHRQAMRDGLRILARIIARTHLRQVPSDEPGPEPYTADRQSTPSSGHV